MCTGQILCVCVEQVKAVSWGVVFLAFGDEDALSFFALGLVCVHGTVEGTCNVPLLLPNEVNGYRLSVLAHGMNGRLHNSPPREIVCVRIHLSTIGVTIYHHF